jgi:hypothetical protein
MPMSHGGFVAYHNSEAQKFHVTLLVQVSSDYDYHPTKTTEHRAVYALAQTLCALFCLSNLVAKAPNAWILHYLTAGFDSSDVVARRPLFNKIHSQVLGSKFCT